MGDYWVRVMASAVEVNQYPAGSVALDQNAFFVLTGSVNEDEPPLAATLPDNARCRMRENFGPYQSPPGNPPRATLPADSGNSRCVCHRGMAISLGFYGDFGPVAANEIPRENPGCARRNARLIL
jgi:hypothetical protein